MNVEIETVAARFLFWEHLFQILGIGSLQCILLLFALHVHIHRLQEVGVH